jgi:O-antigen/teichoic acid export membrane protein
LESTSLMKKFFQFSIGPLGAAALSLLTTPIITWLIVPKEFGKTEMFMTVYNLLLLCSNFGLDQSFVRYYNQCSNDEEKINLFRLTIKLPFFFNLLLSAILILFWKKISCLLFNSYSFPAIVIMATSLIIGLLNYYAMLVLRMKQKGKAYSLLNLLTSASNSLFIILFALYINKSFISIISAQLFSLVVTFGISLIIEGQFWFSKVNKTNQFTLTELIKFGIPFVPSLLIFWFFSSISRFSLRAWSTFEALGLYSVSFKFVQGLNLFQKAFGTFWVPVAYETYAKRPEDTKFFERIYLFISFVLLFIGVCTILFKDLVVLILHPDYKMAAMVMPFLLFVPMMYMLSEVTVLGINFKKKTKWHIVVASGATLMNIIGNYFLTPHFGAKGTAISSGLSYIGFFLLRTIISKKYYPVNYHLTKTNIMFLLFSLYALYSTFVSFNQYHTIAGIGLLIVLIFQYRDSVKIILEKTKLAINRGKQFAAGRVFPKKI